jgi:predicted dehydrogenase
MGGIGAAVIGTGFIGSVHIAALRRLGITVTGVLGSSPDRGTERAKALGVAKAYPSLEAVLSDPDVDVVHVTSPNRAHYPQVMQILKAGKHVVCEKPLAMTSAQSREMTKLAHKTNKVAAVCHTMRFYPLNQQARGMVAKGELGDIRLIRGYFHQDWLALPTDWNWRLEQEEGGVLRSVGDIGTHWVDLTCFIAGLRATSVFADLATFIKVREKPVGPVGPVGPVETFTKARGKTVKKKIETDDVSTVLLRYSNGARGVMSTSQVSFGRKCSLQWDITGSKASAAWDFEAPENLWIGHRDRPNELLQRDPSLMNPLGARAATVPGGHVEGYNDSFFAFFRQVYGDVAKGKPSKSSTYATFDDGHDEMLFCDAVLKSAKSGRWADIANA